MELYVFHAIIWKSYLSFIHKSFSVQLLRVTFLFWVFDVKNH